MEVLIVKVIMVNMNRISHISKVLTCVLASLCLVVLSPMQNIMAIDGKFDPNFYADNNILYYNPDDTGDSCVTQVDMGDVNTGEVAKTVFLFLTSTEFAGLGGKMNAAQAAGVLGNLFVESGFNPAIVQSGQEYNESTALSSIGGYALGLVQWDGGRRVTLVNFAKEKGKPWSDLSLQLEFIKYELDGAEGVSLKNNSFLSANDAVTAASIWSHIYERPAVPDNPERTSAAEKYYAEFKDLAPDSSYSIDSDSSSSNKCSDSSSGGVASSDGVTFPLKTTQESLMKGAHLNGTEHNNDGTNGLAWCYTATSNCHHDYNAADIHDLTGTPVLAARSGTIIQVTSLSYGREAVTIKADNGLVIFNVHMLKGSTAHLKEGQSVSGGDQIGQVGTSQDADNTAPHVHVDVLEGEDYRVNCSNGGCNSYNFLDYQPVWLELMKKLPEK